MASMENDFASFMNGIANAFANYVANNYEDLNGKSAEEITEKFIEVFKIPKVTVPSVSLPVLTGPAIPTGLAGKESVRKPRALKANAPQQAWVSLNDYEKLNAEGAKVCAYLASRGNNKDKVCAALCDETPEADPLMWRCITCKGKESAIGKKLKTAVQGVDPGKVIPGFTVPTGAGLPNIPMPNLPSMLKIGGVPSIPALSSGLPNLPSMTAPLIPLVKPLTPKAPSPKPEGPFELALHPGLNAGHYVSKNPPLKNIIFSGANVNGATVIKSIGKYPTDLPTEVEKDYSAKLVQLSTEEQSLILKYNSEIEYKFINAIPSVGGLPSIPGF